MTDSTQEQEVVGSVPTGLFIGGEWQPAENGATFPVDDPSTGRKLADDRDVTALVVAGAIVSAGVRLVTSSSRILVDEALPAEELDRVREVMRAREGTEVLGFHALRARRGGSRRYIDMHVQFRHGTTLERAHELAHELQSEIRGRLGGGADVLIHLEPESALRQVDRGGGTDREDHAEVARIAVHEQQNGGH